MLDFSRQKRTKGEYPLFALHVDDLCLLVDDLHAQQHGFTDGGFNVVVRDAQRQAGFLFVDEKIARLHVHKLGHQQAAFRACGAVLLLDS